MSDRAILENLKLDAKDALILKKLFEIEKRLDKKIAYLLVEDAVEMFRAYLQEKKKPAGYNYTLDLFKERFFGKNIADGSEVNAVLVNQFMIDFWGDSKSNTIRVRHAQLNGLFNHASKILQMKGAPDFPNPMSLITQPGYEYKEVHFLPPEQIIKIVNSVKLIHHWLALAILASTGIRPGELLKLTAKDVDGQVLTLRDPKSGNSKEWAVVPKTVSDALHRYITNFELQVDDSIIPLSHNNLNEGVVQRYSKKCGTLFTPKYFRNWAATFWRRQNDPDMVSVILRHKTDSEKNSRLRRIYIASLSQEEVIERQKISDKILFAQNINV